MGGCTSSKEKQKFSSKEETDFHASSLINRNQFHFGSIIGEGGFAVIREVRHIMDDKWFALKENNLLKVSADDAKVILNELNSLVRVGAGGAHPFIIHLHLAFRDARATYMVLDLLTAGDLRIYLGNREIFTESKAAFIAVCIGSALHHIHSRKIIHRDLKPENILFDPTGYPYVTDFGLSYGLHYKAKYCICERMSGTSEYFAPELFVPQTHYHGFESDFWSLGIILYEILFRRRPCDDPPKNLIRYSRDTYSKAWATLISKHDAEMLKIQHDDDILFDGANAQEWAADQLSADLSWTATNCITIGQFVNPPPDGKDLDTLDAIGEDLEVEVDENPLSSDLRIPIPALTFAKQNPSEELINLLNSLLDVRIDKRIGVGSRYNLFLHHPWFTSQGVSFDGILTKSVPSPITPDLNLVADKICAKLMKTNFEDENQTDPSSRRPLPSDEINTLIGSFTYLSPEYTSLYFPPVTKTIQKRNSMMSIISTRMASNRTVPINPHHEQHFALVNPPPLTPSTTVTPIGTHLNPSSTSTVHH